MGRPRTRVGRLNLICEWCGKFLEDRSQVQCCSRSCSAKWQFANKPRVLKGRKNLVCEWCGKLLSRRQNHYCCKSCASHSKRQSTYVLRKNIICEWCGNLLSGRQTNFCSAYCKNKWKGVNNQLGVSLSDETRARMSQSQLESYANYIYDPSTATGYRKLAIDTYGYVCRGCGTTQGILDVHHLNGNHYDDRVDNLVVLCKSCHCRIHPTTARGDSTPDPVMTEYVIRRRDSQS